MPAEATLIPVFANTAIQVSASIDTFAVERAEQGRGFTFQSWCRCGPMIP